MRGKQADPKHYLRLPTSIYSNPDLTAMDKLIYEGIYTMLTTTHNFYMSNRNFAKYAGTSKASVYKSINHLVDYDLIRTHTVYHGKRAVGRYIYWGGYSGKRNNDKVATRVNEDGYPSDPNTLKNKLRQTDDEKTKRNHSAKPKIMNLITTYFFVSNFYLGDLSSVVDKWLKKYSVKTIIAAVNSANEQQLKRGTKIRRAANYINVILLSKDNAPKPKLEPSEANDDNFGTIDEIKQREKENEAKALKRLKAGNFAKI